MKYHIFNAIKNHFFMRQSNFYRTGYFDYIIIILNFYPFLYFVTDHLVFIGQVITEQGI